jgi:peptide deformylase
MSLMNLHLLGSPVLRQHSAAVQTVDDDVRRLIADMFETMDAAKGIGLAANQVGVARRVAVVDVDDDRFIMVNPRILETEGRASAEEGCLSIPDIYADVTRPDRVVIEALDAEGNSYRKEVSRPEPSSMRSIISTESSFWTISAWSSGKCCWPSGAASIRTTLALPKRSPERLPGRSDADRLLRDAGLCPGLLPSSAPGPL